MLSTHLETQVIWSAGSQSISAFIWLHFGEQNLHPLKKSPVLFFFFFPHAAVLYSLPAFVATIGIMHFSRWIVKTTKGTSSR